MYDLAMAFLTFPVIGLAIIVDDRIGHGCLCPGILSTLFLAVMLLLLVTVTLIALPPLAEARKRLPSRVNTVAYASCASGLLGFLLIMGGLPLPNSSWLESAMFFVGLALFLCFLVGMSVVMYQLRRLLSRR